MAVNMNLCNYNWNMANLSLHSTFDTLLRLQYSSKRREQYIQITPQKLNVASFRADWGSTKFKIHWCILSSVYFFFAAEETIMIEFAR